MLVALALFVIKRTGSASDLGLVLAAQALPPVALLLFGGVWADRLPRHRVMIATDVVRLTLHGLLAALIFTDVVRAWEIAGALSPQPCTRIPARLRCSQISPDLLNMEPRMEPRRPQTELSFAG